MTRDEAMKLMNQELWGGSRDERMAKAWLRVFEALGMLKLEEPNGLGKLKDVMKPMGYSAPCVTFRDIEEALNLGGLKIVEK